VFRIKPATTVLKLTNLGNDSGCPLIGDYLRTENPGSPDVLFNEVVLTEQAGGVFVETLQLNNFPQPPSAWGVSLTPIRLDEIWEYGTYYQVWERAYPTGRLVITSIDNEPSYWERQATLAAKYLNQTPETKAEVIQGGFEVTAGWDTGKYKIRLEAPVSSRATAKAIKLRYDFREPKDVGFTVETETAATVPTDRTRKKLGVGESVVLTVKPSGLSPITWSKTGEGTLSATSGGSVTFTAHDKASSASITATYEGVPYTVFFWVIEPVSESAVKLSEYTFPAGTQGAGMKLVITVHPTDVSFQNVELLEIPGPATNITGYFTQFPADDLAHSPNPEWTPLNPDNKLIDNVADRYRPPLWSTGGYQWVIPVQWSVWGSVNIGTLPDRIQTVSITDDNGTTTISKLGQSVTRTP
jgi:hypothetical protein